MAREGTGFTLPPEGCVVKGLKFLAGRVSVHPVKWIGTVKGRELSNGELVLLNVVVDAEPDAGAGACPENEKEASCGTAALDGWAGPCQQKCTGKVATCLGDGAPGLAATEL